MSILGLADHSAAEDTDTTGTTPDGAPADTEPAEPAPPPEPVAVPLPPKRLSRREQAALDDRKRLDELERKHEETRRNYEHEVSRLRTELAVRPVQVAHVPQPQQVQPQQAPDPDEIYRKADQALDAHNLPEYQRLTRMAQKAERDREWQERAQQFRPQQAQQQAPMDPGFVATLAQYPEVINSPQGQALAVAEDQILQAMGYQPGPQRLHMALTAARNRITGSQKTANPGYDQRSAAALSSAPANGRSAGAPSNGGGSPALMITPDEERTMRAVAKKSGMTWDEYAHSYAGLNPDRVRR